MDLSLIIVIIMWFFSIFSIALTEVILSSKNRSKNDIAKIIIFWIVTVCITLCLCGLHYFGMRFGSVILLPLNVVISIFPLLMIPVRVVFELVLIGLNIERSITSNNNRSERQTYRSNYASNTQNNN